MALVWQISTEDCLSLFTFFHHKVNKPFLVVLLTLSFSEDMRSTSAHEYFNERMQPTFKKPSAVFMLSMTKQCLSLDSSLVVDSQITTAGQERNSNTQVFLCHKDIFLSKKLNIETCILLLTRSNSCLSFQKCST